MRYEDLPRFCNLAEHFLDRNDPARTALVTPHADVSYGDLAALSRRVANALTGLGVRRGDRVLIALRDGPEFVAAWFGAQRIGAITAEVHAFLTGPELRYYLDYLQPAVVIADQVTRPRLPAADQPPRLFTGVDPTTLLPGEYSFEELVSGESDVCESVPVSVDAPAIFKFTTGSTGAPKACVLPARSPLLSFEWYARGVLELRPDDLVLPVPKLFFGYARDLAALFPFGVGAAGLVFPGRSTPDTIFELVQRHRPTALVNVPTMMKAMVDHPRAAGADLSSLRWSTSAAEMLSPELHRRWEELFGVPVLDGVGSSEGYHIYLSNRLGRIRPGSVGQVVAGYRAQVVDGDGQPLPDGGTGRLEVTGAPVALGYWQAPEKSAETFPERFTMRTGDLFRRDQDGFFYFEGRADDLVKVHGRFIAPVEVERWLLTHPRVTECAVTGYDAGDGLVMLRAHVVAAAETTVGELQAHCRSGLPGFKRPRDFAFVDALPRTPSGKVDRRKLRDGPRVRRE